MKQYLELLKDVYENGEERPDRTGTGVKTVFGRQIRIDLNEGFPLLTTKKMAYDSMVHELLWFISGSTNYKDLPESVHKWWDKWADPDGNLGPIYGKQLRASGERKVDQLQEVIKSIKNDPYSRRHVISLWNASDLPDQKLPCCHGTVIQFFVSNDRKLSCSTYQRSCDLYLGGAINIASYALLTHMVAEICGLEVGELIYSFGDLHLYSNHYEQAAEQLKREPLPLPKLYLNPYIEDITQYTKDDIQIAGYKSHPAIKAPLAV